ncbi:hypothetical protein GCM10022216_20680 [Sphingobacterium kyonggiense]|uniref:YdhG-like domain-containing protein n=1 Tax=Sphingobacterium kyonggiense TaxID=714075 RepID=A0ABP7YTK4_9SPHI
MNDASFSTIDEYIASFDKEGQYILNQVRQIIKEVSPKETKETISYKMPTFRYQGNLMHFALFKKHLGLYPGPAAIEAFEKDLKAFKTSKGAIQIPLDKPIPEDLIRKLIAFNVDILKDKKGPTWDSHKSTWVDAEEFMNQLIVKTKSPLKKEFKWGSDVYTFQGKNVIGWGGFKDFFSLWFYNGVFLNDAEKVLVNASEGKTKALRQWRFKDVSEMNEKKILAYIEESVQTIRDGKEIKIERSAPREVTGILKEALNQNKEFHNAFDKLTPGKQKEYIEYIDEAKQEKTKFARIEKIIPLILDGKGLHDKYKK